jgi:hypothetical protein
VKQFNAIPCLPLLLLRRCLIGISALLLAPGHPHAQQIDLDGAANAKAASGRDALAHFAPDAAASVGTFVKFDVPGAANGTDPVAINAVGVITGYYADANRLAHGFLRGPFGGFQTFDVPGAANGTSPSAINAAGTIAGTFSDATSVTHGFVRTAWGSFATFDVPGPINFLFAEAIDAAGVVTGFYLDANFVGHGFLRDSKGKVITFEVPGAGGTAFRQGTYPKALGVDGEIVGLYGDENSVGHGFLLKTNGSFTTFDPPGNVDWSGGAPFDVNFAQNLYINPQGVITGTYFGTIQGNPFGGNWHVFVRNTDGSFTTFDAANYPPCCIWSFPSGITPDGTITGSFNDGATINHGFLRARDGSVTTFDVPGASTGFNLGTAALGITPSGEIMGEYFDTSGIPHGFLLLPNAKID